MTSRPMRALLVVLALVLPSAAQDSRPGPAERLRVLEADFRKEMRAFENTARKLFAEAERLKEEPDFSKMPKPPNGDFIPKFKALAADCQGTDTELSCLLWLFENGGEGFFAMSPPNGAEPAETPRKETDDMIAAKAIMERHLASPRLDGFATGLMFRTGIPGTGRAAKDYLARLAKESPHKEVRAAAILGQMMPAYEAGDEKTAEPLIALLKKDYADTKVYKEQVAGILFERENLTVGKTAPDFEVEDIDGKKFKLSDYRGKVVYLDFWGFW